MITLNSLLLIFILLVVVAIIGVTKAEPQWHNSTDGRLYLIEGDQKYNWFHAHHECARNNLQMVAIDSQEKNEALLAILKPIFGNSHNFWLGANDEYNQNKCYDRPFYWTASGNLMTFSYWSNNNPSNYNGSEHCVHTWEMAPDFRWNDNVCDSSRFGFICEEHYLQVKPKMEKQEHALNDVKNEENYLNKVLYNIQIKMDFDQSHNLIHHLSEIKNGLVDRNKKILKRIGTKRPLDPVWIFDALTKKLPKELDN